MSSIFAGQRCFGSPHTCYPLLYTFVIIADFHSWIFVFYGPVYCSHGTKHLSCHISDRDSCRITAAAGFTDFLSIRCKDHTTKGISANTFLETSIYISNDHIFRYFHDSCRLFCFITGYISCCLHVQKSQCFLFLCKSPKLSSWISAYCLLALRPCSKKSCFMSLAYCIYFLLCHKILLNNQYFDSHYFTIFWLILYNLSFYQASYTMEISQKNNVQIHFKIEINLQTWSYLSTSMFLHVFYNSRYFNQYLLLTCSNYIKYCIPLYLNL